ASAASAQGGSGREALGRGRGVWGSRTPGLSRRAADPRLTATVRPKLKSRCRPRGKRRLECAIARAALLDRQNGAIAIRVNEGDVEPASLLEQGLVGLRIAHRETEQKTAAGKPHRQ